MNTFTSGQTVRRIKDPTDILPVGSIRTVTQVGVNYIDVDGYWYRSVNFEAVDAGSAVVTESAAVGATVRTTQFNPEHHILPTGTVTTIVEQLGDSLWRVAEKWQALTEDEFEIIAGPEETASAGREES